MGQLITSPTVINCYDLLMTLEGQKLELILAEFELRI